MERDFEIPEVTVRLQPDETDHVFLRHKVKTAGQLLKVMGIRAGTAIVARENQLLTPDQPTLPNDVLLVRKVTSSG